MTSIREHEVEESPAPRETHGESWDSALSARPNDGIHLLFYGHSWSSVAPIWPKAHDLSLPPSLFALFPFTLLLNFALHFSLSPPFSFCISELLTNLFTMFPIFHPHSPNSHFPFFVAHCPDVLFMVNSHKLLI